VVSRALRILPRRGRWRRLCGGGGGFAFYLIFVFYDSRGEKRKARARGLRDAAEGVADVALEGGDGDAEGFDAAGEEEGVAGLVAGDLRGVVVAVEFDGEFGFVAVEVEDVRRERVLAAEAEAEELAVAETGPELGFGWAEGAAELAGSGLGCFGEARALGRGLFVGAGLGHLASVIGEAGGEEGEA
jgi:hypothetical protein